MGCMRSGIGVQRESRSLAQRQSEIWGGDQRSGVQWGLMDFLRVRGPGIWGGPYPGIRLMMGPQGLVAAGKGPSD